MNEEFIAENDDIENEFPDQSDSEAADIAEDEIIEESVSEDEIAAEFEPASKEEQLRIVEAILFASPEPVAIGLLQMQLRIEAAHVETLLTELQESYAGRGIQLVQRDGNWIFETASDLKDRLHFISEKPKRLSRAAIETMAIIAYHQPVTRAEIEAIRGVAISKGTIDVLMEAGWVKPGRRRETPGRPLTFITTPDFLGHFGLENLKDLPGVDELKAAGLLDPRAAISVVPDHEAIEAQNETASDHEEDDDLVMSDEIDHDTLDAEDEAA